MNKKTLIILSIVVVALLIVGGTLAFKGSGNETLHTVKKETLEEQVQASGKTKPAQEVELGFVSSGKISKSYAKVGKVVEIGEVLMQLEAADLYADLAKAKADLASESAITASDNISIKESRENLRLVLQQSLITIDNTIQNGVDRYFLSPRTTLADFRPSIVVNSNIVNLTIRPNDRENLNDERQDVEKILRELRDLKVSIDQSSNPEQFSSTLKEDVLKIQVFIDNIVKTLNRVDINDNSYQTGLNSLKDDVANLRFDLQSVMSDILSAESELSATTEQDVPGSGDVSQRNARILKAQAEVQSIQADIAKTIIRSPIQGVVTKVEADPGEIVGSGTTVIGVISDDDFEIEANISEVNISKVDIDNVVRITFDGITGKEFWGKVAYIEPAETIVDDVVTFKVKVILDQVTPEIKSGLTANLTISTNTKENVIAIPAYAVSYKEGRAYVQKLVDGKDKEETEVTTGIIGSNGYIEILSGLKEGDVVVITAA